jgi:flagellar biosynthesis/type III secretory pathway M-ring protein FliF/YscJ
MPSDVSGLLLLLFSFVVTFTIARMAAKWFRRERRRKDEAAARAAESRQVRRARERKNASR